MESPYLCSVERKMRTARSPARKISQVHQNFLPAQSAKFESGTDKRELKLTTTPTVLKNSP